MYEKTEFIVAVSKALGLSNSEADFSFKLFSDGAIKVPGSDVIEAVNKYRKSNPPPTVSERPPPSNKPETVPAISKPNVKPTPLTVSQQNDLVKRVKTQLSKKRLNFEHLFRMADPEDREIVSVIKLKETFRSMVPELPSQDLFELMKILDVSKNGSIELSQYETIMMTDNEDLESIADNDSRIELSRSQLGTQRSMSQSGVSLDNSVMSKSAAPVPSPELGHQKYVGFAGHRLLVSMTTQLEAKEVRPEDVYTWVDLSDDGMVPTLRLIKELQSIVTMKKEEYATIARYLDRSGCGMVTKGDYLSYISNKSTDMPFSMGAALVGEAAAVVPSESKKRASTRITSTNGPAQGVRSQVRADPKRDQAQKSNTKTDLAGILKPSSNLVVKTVKHIPQKSSDTYSLKAVKVMTDSEFRDAVRSLKVAINDSDAPLDYLFEELSIDKEKKVLELESKKGPSRKKKPPKRVPSIKLLQSLQRYLPNFGKLKLRAIIEYMDKEKKGEIKQDDFELIFTKSDENKEKLEISMYDAVR